MNDAGLWAFLNLPDARQEAREPRQLKCKLYRKLQREQCGYEPDLGKSAGLGERDIG